MQLDVRKTKDEGKEFFFQLVVGRKAILVPKSPVTLG